MILEECKKAKLQARIKPTVLCSAIDKENLIESLLDLLYYIYNYYVAMLFGFHDLYATCQLTPLLHVVTVMWLWCDSVMVTWYFPTLVIKKRNIKLSQKVTYYLWWMLWYFKKFTNAKLDEWQKMLLSLRSNPQTMSPYIHNCDSLCTRTDHHMLLPIVLHMVVPLYLK